ncbi:MAG TPA: hypothetical protein DG754_05575 [Bacteroidales bacterium]|nr:hypothetical protein [Bacteroidales bacterium]
MTFFDIIIAPFLYFIEQVYHLAYGLTGNHGVSIILLSFAVSLLLLPIFILIEKTKRRNDAIRQRMKPLADEIKRCYKGQERYYYLKTLNRQHGYSPLKALVPVLTLLLQIPFFIAAYQFLEGYPPLEGVSFLFIKDLSAPDGLLGSVNILPIVMTVVNLVTAYFYTRNGNTAERKQMVVVAVLFLILLFNLPSGLVLYWTMNNVFSFLRLFVTNPEVFKGRSVEKPKVSESVSGLKVRVTSALPKLKKTFVVVLVLAVLSQLNWAISNNFDDFGLRLILALTGSLVITFMVLLAALAYPYIRNMLKGVEVKPVFLYSIFFFSLYFYLANKYFYLGGDNSFGFISLGLIVCVQLVLSLYFIKAYRVIGNLYFGITTVVALFLLMAQLSSLFVFITHLPISLSLAGVNVTIESSSFAKIILPAILFALLLLPYYIRINAIEKIKPHRQYLQVLLLSTLFVAGNIFLWNPLAVYSTFPENFMFSGLKVLAGGVVPFLIIFSALTACYFLIPKGYRWLLLALLIATLMLFTIHSTLLPIDMGTLQGDKFEKPSAISLPQYLYALDALAAVLLFGLSVWLIKNRYVKHTVFALIILNGLTITQSLYKGFKSGNFISNTIANRESECQIEFSKTNRNVVYIIPDMLQGWSMNKMMKEDSTLRHRLDGFVWYPNTLAISRVTNTSIGPLIGGLSCAPDILDKDKERTVSEKLSNIKIDLIRRVNDFGLNFSSNHLTYTSLPDSCYHNFLPEWHHDWDAYLPKIGISSIKDNDIDLLQCNALFFSVPLALKSAVYNEGKWLFGSSGKKSKSVSTSHKHQFLRLLPYISTAKEEKGNFILLYSMVTHFPWNTVNDDGTLNRDVSPYENGVWTIDQLIAWFDWMKQNGVYDNTRIVVVSDHGTHWRRFDKEIEIDIPFRNYGENTLPLNYMLDLNPMLLVKDFGSQGSLREDWQFMSNADAIEMALCDTISNDFPQDSDRILPAFVSWWTKDMPSSNAFSLEHKYMVRKSIFDANNWTMVWDKHKGTIVSD